MFFVRIFFPQFVLNFFDNFRHFLVYASVENYTKKCLKMSQIVDKIQEKKFSRQKTLTPAFQENTVC